MEEVKVAYQVEDLSYAVPSEQRILLKSRYLILSQ